MKQNHKYIKFDRDNMLHDRHSLQGVGLKHLRGKCLQKMLAKFILIHGVNSAKVV